MLIQAGLIIQNPVWIACNKCRTTIKITLIVVLSACVMATLLRKVWETVSSRAGSAACPGVSSSPELGSRLPPPPPSASAGVFDQLPADIFLQILKCLGPKDAARAGLVCKAWRALAEDDRLWIHFIQSENVESWESIVFAEKNLRSGYPLQ